MVRFQAFILVFASSAYLLSGCRNSPHVVPCSPVNPDNPEIFTRCTYGSGVFGKWRVDEYGLPAYEYILHEESDPRALWWNSEGKKRREHWHQIGNSRVTAAAYNDGYIQLFSEENGFKWFNYYDTAGKNYAGGFSYIYDGEQGWSTAYAFRPQGSFTERVFGMGYARTETEYRNIVVTRTTYAPYGDDPLLLSDVEVTNTGAAPKEITHYEYWDVNIHQMLLTLISSGVLDPAIPGRNEDQRTLFNRYFTQSAQINPQYQAGVVGTSLINPVPSELALPPTGSAKTIDDSPPLVFLAPLDTGTGSTDEAYIFAQSSFFGSGDAARPDGLGTVSGIGPADPVPSSLQGVPGLGQPLALIHRTTFALRPGESRLLRYAYGFTDTTAGLSTLDRYRGQGASGLPEMLDALRSRLAYFAPEADPFLHRETAWHSYYLGSAAYYRRYFDMHIVSQGGQYVFGHGFDGATRDYCIFSIPLSYMTPPLAKEILKFMMMTTTPDGQMAYGNFGDVGVANVATLALPSDLDIFFFWAMSEYLLTTRDFGFLNEHVSFYATQGVLSPTVTTVLDHIRTAYDHLVNVVGVGEHNLIRLRTGDWSDGILWFTDDPALAEEKGESTFNTAFAAAVLPAMASAIADNDPDLASQMLGAAQSYTTAMQNQWAGRWYYRGRQGDGTPFGEDTLFLEPQVWSLIAGIPDADRTRTLVRSLHDILDAGSRAGARIVYPPKKNIFGGLLPGTDVNGGIWPATNSLLTWAYSLTRPDYAWESLKKNTLATHAEAYPNLWYGIWSGPDSYNAPESSRPGEAAAHYATALTDFPVMNMNQHANPLLALIKIAGIFPEKDGIRISPAIPLKRWTLDLPLLGISYSPGSISGYYQGMTGGTMTMTVTIPDIVDPSSVVVEAGGGTVPFTLSGRDVSFPLDYIANQKTAWGVSFPAE